jgi:predicted membrane-bound spermidine synthase
MLYAIDLLGGSLGALVLSGYLIPVFGFWKTAWLTAAVNLAPALLATQVSIYRIGVLPRITKDQKGA